MKIPFLIESKGGHETQNVDKKDVPEKVKEQLKDGKWVSVEKEDGKVEMLTKKDLPKDDNPLSNLEWVEKFENVKSIATTNKIKGG